MKEAGVALVTGGSRGIGRVIVELLAARGNGVLVTYLRNEARANEVVAAVAQSGGQLVYVNGGGPRG